VVFGHEVRSFRACDAREPLWAVDSTGALWELTQELAAGSPPYSELYAVIEGRRGPAPTDGFGADYAGTLVVGSVFHIAAEGDRCGTDLRGLRFWAGGNEPFWTVSMLSQGLELRRLGHEPVLWGEVSEEVAGTSLSVNAEGSERNPEEVRIVLSKEPCHDTMSGSYFGYSARLFLPGETLFGCAFRGGDHPGGGPRSGTPSRDG
jgi:putative lipoprotein